MTALAPKRSLRAQIAARERLAHGFDVATGVALVLAGLRAFLVGDPLGLAAVVLGRQFVQHPGETQNRVDRLVTLISSWQAGRHPLEEPDQSPDSQPIR